MAKNRRKKKKKQEVDLKEVCIYTRVSSKMQEDNFSRDAQERICREFAERKGWKVYKVYSDVGSGRDIERDGLQQLMEDAKAGYFQFFCSARLDRVSRKMRDMLEILDELEKIGVSYASATEQFDFSTPIGKVARTMIMALAEYYSDNLSVETIKGQTERAIQGFWMQRLAAGYTSKKEIIETKRSILAGVFFKILANGTKVKLVRDIVSEKNLAIAEETAAEKEESVPDAMAIQDRNAAGMKLMFDLARDGVFSLQDIANELNAAGYKPTGRTGARSLPVWSPDSVAYALGNDFYVGDVWYRGER